MRCIISTYFNSIYNFVTKGHDRTVKAKKNILSSIIIKGCSIAISLLLVPLTIHYVNPTRYGIWITLSSIIGWFGFFDIGLGNGLRNKFAEAVAKGETNLARSYVSTIYILLSLIIGFVLIAFFCINPFLSWTKILNAPSNMAGELNILALLVFSFFCIQFVLQLINTVLTANQEPAKPSLLSLLGSLISLFVIFILTRTTKGNLVYLGAAFGSAPIIVLTISSLWFYHRGYKKYAPSIRYLNFSLARDLMSLGLKFFFLQIAVIILYQTNNIIIAQLFGPEQVTPYNIAYKYFSIIPMFFGIILTPFWSAITDAWVHKDVLWIKNSMKKLISVWVLFGIAGIIMLVFADRIYKLWVGKEIIVPISLSVALTVYVIMNAWNGIFSQFLNGVGKIKLQIYAGILDSLLNIPLALFFGKLFGITGVMISSCLIAISSAIWSPIQYSKIINSNAKGIWNK